MAIANEIGKRNNPDVSIQRVFCSEIVRLALSIAATSVRETANSEGQPAPQTQQKHPYSQQPLIEPSIKKR
jgi:hypothetical protein